MSIPAFRSLLWRAQDGKCWICSQKMLNNGNKPESATLDHLWPKSVYGHIGDFGLCLLAHQRCNSKRGNPRPTDDEIRQLIATYRRIPTTTLLGELRQLEGLLAGVEAVKLRRGIVEHLIWAKPRPAA